MRLRVHPEKLRGVDVSISLRRAETRVAEELLDRAEIRASLQQMRRKRMTQSMRTHAGPDTARGGIATDETVDAANGKTCAAIVDEQRIGHGARASAWCRQRA